LGFTGAGDSLSFGKEGWQPALLDFYKQQDT